MTQTMIILVRDLKRPVAQMPTPEPFRVQTIATPRDEYFPALDQFCTLGGFPVGWAQLRLEAAARAWLVIGPDQAGAVASAWSTAQPMFIDEIGYTFTPPQRGDYFFGAFVAPAWRGRHLQRLLINRRLHASAAADRRWAMAIIHTRNRVSLRNDQSEGFTAAAKLMSLRRRDWRADHLRRVASSLPYGSLSGNGWHRRLALSLGWAT